MTTLKSILATTNQLQVFFGFVSMFLTIWMSQGLLREKRKKSQVCKAQNVNWPDRSCRLSRYRHNVQAVASHKHMTGASLTRASVLQPAARSPRWLIDSDVAGHCVRYVWSDLYVRTSQILSWPSTPDVAMYLSMTQRRHTVNDLIDKHVNSHTYRQTNRQAGIQTDWQKARHTPNTCKTDWQTAKELDCTRCKDPEFQLQDSSWSQRKEVQSIAAFTTVPLKTLAMTCGEVQSRYTSKCSSIRIQNEDQQGMQVNHTVNYRPHYSELLRSANSRNIDPTKPSGYQLEVSNTSRTHGQQSTYVPDRSTATEVTVARWQSILTCGRPEFGVHRETTPVGKTTSVANSFNNQSHLAFAMHETVVLCRTKEELKLT